MVKIIALVHHKLIAFSTLLILFLLVSTNSFAQDNILNNKQAEGIKTELQKEKTDTGKIKKLLALAWYQILKAGESKIDLDSAKSYLSQAANFLRRKPSNENWGFYNLVCSNYYNESGEKKTAEGLLDKAINNLKAGNDPFLLGTAYAEKMNRIELSTETAPVKINLIQLAAAAFIKTSNKRKLGDCMRLLADLRIYLKDDPRALFELDSAKRLYQEGKSGDWQQLYIVYAHYYNLQDNDEKYLESILNALRNTSADDKSSQVVRLRFYASVSYYKLKDYNQSLNYSLGALNITVKEKNNTDYVYAIARFAVRAYSKLGKPMEGFELLNRIEREWPEEKGNYSLAHLTTRMLNYEALQQLAKARVYFDLIADRIKRRLNVTDVELYNCYDNVCNFCIDTHQYAKAREMLAGWKVVCLKFKKTDGLPLPYLNAAIKLDTARKDYKAAVNSLINAKNISDTLFSSTRTRQLREMGIQYQMEKRENESKLQQQKILILTEQQKLESASLQAASVTRNIVLASAVCILIITVLIYRQYHNGRKNNRIIAGNNKHLQRLLDENEFLMKEVHHRVKNNLQIVTSLLNSQSAYLTEGAALDAIMKSKGRVESIALIHQKLYKSESQSSIYMPEYIHELVEYLKSSFVEDQNVWFDVVIDAIELDVSNAVPIGLIINESVTNSIKHAFNSENKNANNFIQIILKREGGELELMIRDNGKGFDNSGAIQNNSFGLILIKGLSKDLGGKHAMYNDGGTVVQVSFKPASITRLPQVEISCV